MNRLRATYLILSIAGAIFAPAVSIYAAIINPYAKALKETRALSQSPNVRLLNYGVSYNKRAIPAFAITDFSSGLRSKARIFICAGQHGDEAAPVQSLLSLCRQIVSDRYPKLLSNCVFIVVPVANPDGLATAQRLNAQELDINRDWLTFQTKETRYIDKLIQDWKPNVLIDVHEWLNASPVPGNEIETGRCTEESQEEAVNKLAVEASRDAHLNVLQCSISSNRNLFHRRYAMLGYAAYLLETAAGTSYDKRNRAYSSAILSIANAVARNSEDRLLMSPASEDIDYALVSKELAPLKKIETKASFNPAVLVSIMFFYCIVIWVIKTSRYKDESSWSHKLTRCAVEPDIQADPIAFKYTLYPITYRSWINRRLRSPYVKKKITLVTMPQNDGPDTGNMLKA